MELYSVTESVIIERHFDVTLGQISDMIGSGFYAAVFRIVDGVVEYANPDPVSGMVKWVEAKVPKED